MHTYVVALLIDGTMPRHIVVLLIIPSIIVTWFKNWLKVSLFKINSFEILQNFRFLNPATLTRKLLLLLHHLGMMLGLLKVTSVGIVLGIVTPMWLLHGGRSPGRTLSKLMK